MTTPKFSKKEEEVIKYLLEGKSNKQIAQKLSVSIRTVEFHLSNIYARLDTRSRTETALKLTEINLSKTAGKNTSKVLRDSTVVKKNIDVDNGENPIRRRFTMKNLLIGILVGVLVTVLIIFTASYINESDGVATPTLSLETTIFKNFTVISDTAGELRFTVDYVYNGDNGPIIFSAGCLKNGQATCVPTDIYPFELSGRGNGQLVVSLGLYGPDKITTDQIFIAIFHRDGIGQVYYQRFDYIKQWAIVLPTPTMVR